MLGIDKFPVAAAIRFFLPACVAHIAWSYYGDEACSVKLEGMPGYRIASYGVITGAHRRNDAYAWPHWSMGLDSRVALSRRVPMRINRKEREVFGSINVAYALAVSFLKEREPGQNCLELIDPSSGLRASNLRWTATAQKDGRDWALYETEYRGAKAKYSATLAMETRSKVRRLVATLLCPCFCLCIWG